MERTSMLIDIIYFVSGIGMLFDIAVFVNRPRDAYITGIGMVGGELAGIPILAICSIGIYPERPSTQYGWIALAMILITIAAVLLCSWKMQEHDKAGNESSVRAWRKLGWCTEIGYIATFALCLYCIRKGLG